MNGKEGTTLSFNAVASHPDDEPFTLSASGLPPVATFDRLTGVFVWLPLYDTARSEPYVVTFTADDQRRNVTRTAAIIITDVNQARVVFVPADRTVNEGVEVTFTVSASAADSEDQVTITSPDKPAGAVFDGHTFSWTPGFSLAAKHTRRDGGHCGGS